MAKRSISIGLILLSVFCMIGCGGLKRGLYSPDAAKECFAANSDKLRSAAKGMENNTKIKLILKGYDSNFTDGVWTYVNGCSVFSEEALSRSEISELTETILPAFDDPLLGSIRRQTCGFAAYIVFWYYSSPFDNIYLLAFEAERSGDGILTDLDHITDMHDLGDGWYAVRVSS